MQRGESSKSKLPSAAGEAKTKALTPAAAASTAAGKPHHKAGTLNFGAKAKVKAEPAAAAPAPAPPLATSGKGKAKDDKGEKGAAQPASGKVGCLTSARACSR